MRAVVQRVKSASVKVDGRIVGQIEAGLLLFLGVGRDDTEKDIDWMIEKIINLRIFEKQDGKFDLSLLDIDGELLIVSQFTLYGDCARGRRPSFSGAMEIPAQKLSMKSLSKGRKGGCTGWNQGYFRRPWKSFLSMTGRLP
jgi:D-tyrosyl-tRNA(Tyr) deacylase